MRMIPLATSCRSSSFNFYVIDEFAAETAKLLNANNEPLRDGLLIEERSEIFGNAYFFENGYGE